MSEIKVLLTILASIVLTISAQTEEPLKHAVQQKRSLSVNPIFTSVFQSADPSTSFMQKFFEGTRHNDTIIWKNIETNSRNVPQHEEIMKPTPWISKSTHKFIYGLPKTEIPIEFGGYELKKEYSVPTNTALQWSLPHTADLTPFKEILIYNHPDPVKYELPEVTLSTSFVNTAPVPKKSYEIPNNENLYFAYALPKPNVASNYLKYEPTDTYGLQKNSVPFEGYELKKEYDVPTFTRIEWSLPNRADLTPSRKKIISNYLNRPKFTLPDVKLSTSFVNTIPVHQESHDIPNNNENLYFKYSLPTTKVADGFSKYASKETYELPGNNEYVTPYEERLPNNKASSKFVAHAAPYDSTSSTQFRSSLQHSIEIPAITYVQPQVPPKITVSDHWIEHNPKESYGVPKRNLASTQHNLANSKIYHAFLKHTTLYNPNITLTPVQIFSQNFVEVPFHRGQLPATPDAPDQVPEFFIEYKPKGGRPKKHIEIASFKAEGGVLVSIPLIPEKEIEKQHEEYGVPKLELPVQKRAKRSPISTVPEHFNLIPDSYWNRYYNEIAKNTLDEHEVGSPQDDESSESETPIENNDVKITKFSIPHKNYIVTVTRTDRTDPPRKNNKHSKADYNDSPNKHNIIFYVNGVRQNIPPDSFLRKNNKFDSTDVFSSSPVTSVENINVNGRNYKVFQETSNHNVAKALQRRTKRSISFNPIFSSVFNNAEPSKHLANRFLEGASRGDLNSWNTNYYAPNNPYHTNKIPNTYGRKVKNCEQPNKGIAQPFKEYGLPSSINLKPLESYGIPYLKTNRPAINYGPPKFVLGKPFKEYGAPNVLEPKPHEFYGIPIPETKNPAINYGPPKFVVSKPFIEYSTPNAPEPKPHVSYEIPYPEIKIPAINYGPPKFVVSQPFIEYSVPNTPGPKPHESYEIPYPEIKKPAINYGPPKFVVSKPFIEYSVPNTPGPKPHESYEIPYSEIKKPPINYGPPKFVVSKPFIEYSVPNTPGPKPHESYEIPYPEIKKPAINYGPPKFVVSKPFIEYSVPNTPGPKPHESYEIPYSEIKKPAINYGPPKFVVSQPFIEYSVTNTPGPKPHESYEIPYPEIKKPAINYGPPKFVVSQPFIEYSVPNTPGPKPHESYEIPYPEINKPAINYGPPKFVVSKPFAEYSIPKASEPKSHESYDIPYPEISKPPINYGPPKFAVRKHFKTITQYSIPKASAPKPYEFHEISYPETNEPTVNSGPPKFEISRPFQKHDVPKASLSNLHETYRVPNHPYSLPKFGKNKLFDQYRTHHPVQVPIINVDQPLVKNKLPNHNIFIPFHKNDQQANEVSTGHTTLSTYIVGQIEDKIPKFIYGLPKSDIRYSFGPSKDYTLNAIANDPHIKQEKPPKVFFTKPFNNIISQEAHRGFIAPKSILSNSFYEVNGIQPVNLVVPHDGQASMYNIQVGQIEQHNNQIAKAQGPILIPSLPYNLPQKEKISSFQYHDSQLHSPQGALSRSFGKNKILATPKINRANFFIPDFHVPNPKISQHSSIEKPSEYFQGFVSKPIFSHASFSNPQTPSVLEQVTKPTTLPNLHTSSSLHGVRLSNQKDMYAPIYQHTATKILVPHSQNAHVPEPSYIQKYPQVSLPNDLPTALKENIEYNSKFSQKYSYKHNAGSRKMSNRIQNRPVSSETVQIIDGVKDIVASFFRNKTSKIENTNPNSIVPKLPTEKSVADILKPSNNRFYTPKPNSIQNYDISTDTKGVLMPKLFKKHPFSLQTDTAPLPKDGHPKFGETHLKNDPITKAPVKDIVASFFKHKNLNVGAVTNGSTVTVVVPTNSLHRNEAFAESNRSDIPVEQDYIPSKLTQKNIGLKSVINNNRSANSDSSVDKNIVSYDNTLEDSKKRKVLLKVIKRPMYTNNHVVANVLNKDRVYEKSDETIVYERNLIK